MDAMFLQMLMIACLGAVYSQKRTDLFACMKKCNDSPKGVVCDDKGTPYKNQCMLDMMNCFREKTNTPLIVKGTCKDCIQDCEISKGKPNKVCDQNGKTYMSMCNFLNAKCTSDVPLNVVPCAKKPVQSCTKDCKNAVRKPVCDQNKKSYPSQCVFDIVNCLNERKGNPSLQLVDCPACLTDCGKVLEKPRSVCDQNGQGYKSMCEFNNNNCMQGGTLVVTDCKIVGAKKELKRAIVKAIDKISDAFNVPKGKIREQMKENVLKGEGKIAEMKEKILAIFEKLGIAIDNNKDNVFSNIKEQLKKAVLKATTKILDALNVYNTKVRQNVKALIVSGDLKVDDLKERIIALVKMLRNNQGRGQGRNGGNGEANGGKESSLDGGNKGDANE